jgi:hypothetical protein
MLFVFLSLFMGSSMAFRVSSTRCSARGIEFRFSRVFWPQKEYCTVRE